MAAIGPSSPTQEPTPPEHPRHDDDSALASAQIKVESNPNGAEDGEDENGDDNHDDSSNDDDGPSRKRRRSRKGLDKKFDCPDPDCGKSYSRAEHLFVKCAFLFLVAPKPTVHSPIPQAPASVEPQSQKCLQV